MNNQSQTKEQPKQSDQPEYKDQPLFDMKFKKGQGVGSNFKGGKTVKSFKEMGMPNN